MANLINMQIIVSLIYTFLPLSPDGDTCNGLSFNKIKSPQPKDDLRGNLPCGSREEDF